MRARAHRTAASSCGADSVLSSKGHRVRGFRPSRGWAGGHPACAERAAPRGRGGRGGLAWRERGLARVSGRGWSGGARGECARGCAREGECERGECAAASPFPVTSECIVVRGAARRSIPGAVTAAAAAAAAQREPRTSEPGRPAPPPPLPTAPPPPPPARRAPPPARAPPPGPPHPLAPSLPPAAAAAARAPPPAERVRVTGSLGHCLCARTPSTPWNPPTSSSEPSMRCKHERQEEEEGPHLGRGCPPGTYRPPPAARRRPRVPPAPSLVPRRPAAAETATSSRSRRLSAELLLFVILREWACPGAPVCVCACARGGAQRLSRGAPRPPRPGPPGTLLPVLRCRARLCLLHG